MKYLPHWICYRYNTATKFMCIKACFLARFDAAESLHLVVLQALPRAECCAHGPSNDHVQQLRSQVGPRLVALCLEIEIPRYAIVGVCRRDVQSKSWQEVSAPGLPQLCGDSKRNIYLGDQKLDGASRRVVDLLALLLPLPLKLVLLPTVGQLPQRHCAALPSSATSRVCS